MISQPRRPFFFFFARSHLFGWRYGLRIQTETDGSESNCKYY